MTATTQGAADEPRRPWEGAPERRPILPGWMRDHSSRKHAARRWAARGTPATMSRSTVCVLPSTCCARWPVLRVGSCSASGTHGAGCSTARGTSYGHTLSPSVTRRGTPRWRVSARIAFAPGCFWRWRGLRVPGCPGRSGGASAWPPGLYVLAAAVVLGLAYLGRPQNTPLIDHAVVSPAAGEDHAGRDRACARCARAVRHQCRAFKAGREIQFIATRRWPRWPRLAC